MKPAVVSAKRLTMIWIVLLAATALSWILGHGTIYLAPRNAGTVIVLIAFLKIRFVMLEFMEIRCAPLPMRVACEAWIMIMCAGIVFLYRS